MKKFFAAAALAVMLMSVGASADVVSPKTSEVPPPPETKVPSPKTSDFNIVLVEVLGAAFAATAVVTGVRARKDA